MRKDHFKSENIFYSDIFKYEHGLTKYDLIPKRGLLQRSFIHWNFQTIVTADAFLHCLRIKLSPHFLEIVQKPLRCSVYKKTARLQACNAIKKETLVQVFSCKFCEIFIYRTPPDDCFLLFESVKTSQQFPGNVFLSFESRLTFYWKRHYSICIPKNWNILTWFVCHSTEYLKLKWIDRRHFLGKRSVVILKIIYFLFKWFLEFSDLASTVTKKQSSP